MPKSNNFSKILILRERTKEVYGICWLFPISLACQSYKRRSGDNILEMTIFVHIFIVKIEVGE